MNSVSLSRHRHKVVLACTAHLPSYLHKKIPGDVCRIRRNVLRCLPAKISRFSSTAFEYLSTFCFVPETAVNKNRVLHKDTHIIMHRPIWLEVNQMVINYMYAHSVILITN